MKKLWHYQDYVNHLTHPNKMVRRWALEALENQYPKRYTDDVSKLIYDEEEFLVCTALRYLSKHGAVEHAPAILDCFKNGQDNIPGNCAIALGDLRYEPAVEVMFEHFSGSKNENTLLGILHYFGKIHREDCRDALKSVIMKMEDSFILESAMFNLLNHYKPEDVIFILDRYLDLVSGDPDFRQNLKGVSKCFGGSDYFYDLTELGVVDFLEHPYAVMDYFFEKNFEIKTDAAFRENMLKALKSRRYLDLCTDLLSDVHTIIHERYPQGSVPEWLQELAGKDRLCLTLLEKLSKDPAVWQRAKGEQEVVGNLVSLLISSYFAIKERGVYIKAMSPDANKEDLFFALKSSGSRLPEQIQKKIKGLGPISELKITLTEDLLTWGDIWAAKMMGQIGNKEFVPDLIHILAKTDSLDHIYEEAITAIHSLDESADEMIITAIQSNELDDIDTYAILEHLPYAEAYDLALGKWENEDDSDMDSYELFATCLLRIGDPRGIEKLQEIYGGENNATYIGDALECLSLIHNATIPEIPDIHSKREQRNARQKARMEKLNELALGWRNKKENGTPGNIPNSVPFKRETPKIGRNAPCPCGSGKKYKKCCLNRGLA